MKTAEFCPKCYFPLESFDEDDGRLCEVCHWFGDKSEICASPPAPDDLELAFSQLLAMYRDICRMELTAEGLAESGDYETQIKAIRARVSQSRHSILHLFRATQNKNDEEETPT